MAGYGRAGTQKEPVEARASSRGGRRHVGKAVSWEAPGLHSATVPTVGGGTTASPLGHDKASLLHTPITMGKPPLTPEQ